MGSDVEGQRGQTHIAQHFRILFCAGVLQDASVRRPESHYIAEIFELIKSHKVACTSSDGSESAQGLLAHDERVVVELFAELVVQLRAGHANKPPPEAQEEKRCKIATPLEWLSTQIFTDARAGAFPEQPCGADSIAALRSTTRFSTAWFRDCMY